PKKFSIQELELKLGPKLLGIKTPERIFTCVISISQEFFSAHCPIETQYQQNQACFNHLQPNRLLYKQMTSVHHPFGGSGLHELSNDEQYTKSRILGSNGHSNFTHQIRRAGS